MVSQSVVRAGPLGWLSLGLGGILLGFPGPVSKLIGLRDDSRHRNALRGVAVRELANGLAIFGAPRSSRGVWARVLGDAIDLGLLGAATRGRRNDTRRLAFAGAVIAGVAVLDAISAGRLQRNRPMSDAGKRKKEIRRTAAVTISGDRVEIERAWQTIAGGDTTNATFASAPGGRGTEVRLSHGMFGGRTAEAKLRRLKQTVETGEPIVANEKAGKDWLR